jgi:membrane protein DedA with SNARE-associated domain
MAMLERYGGPAVFLGRFVAVARAVIPGLAGVSGLRYRTFLFYNALGGLIWGIGYTVLGYVVGLSFERILQRVGEWSLAVVGAVVVAFVVGQVLLRRRERRRLREEFGGDPPEGAAGSDGTDGAGGGDPGTTGAAEATT